MKYFFLVAQFYLFSHLTCSLQNSTLNTTSASTNDSSKDTAQPTVPPSTLEFLCNLYDIAKENCTCLLFNIDTKDGESNSLCNKTDTEVKYENYETKEDVTWRTVYASLAMFSSVLGVCGNLIVILIKPKSKNIKKISQHRSLIIALAVCDLCFALVTIFRIVPLFWTGNWIYGLVLCKLTISAIAMGAWVAVGMVLIIAIERFMGIVYPFKSGLTGKKTATLVIVNMIITVGSVVPLYMHLQLLDRGISNNIKEDHYECREEWSRPLGNIIYSWFLIAGYFIIPVFLISVIYWKIFKVLYNNDLLKRANTKDQDNHFVERRLKRNRKTMTTLLLVLIAFVMCTLPNKLRHLIRATSINSIVFGPALFFITEIVYTFHVAANPIIYSMMDSRFKRKLRKYFNVCGAPTRDRTSTGSSSLSM